MRLGHLLPATTILAFLPASQGASIQAIADLFSTGVDAAGSPLAESTADPHYDFSAVPVGENPPGPIAINSSHGFPIGPWMGDNATSSWIVPGPTHDGVNGDYTYRTTFTIPAGVDPTQVFVRGQGTSDNATTDVRINGVSTGITFSGNFPALDPQFTIQGGFVAGVNTLEFTVNEAGGGPSGLRVELAGSQGPAGHRAIEIFNTGVDAAGLALADNAADRHWVITSGATPGDPVAATSAGGFPIGPWLGDSLDSAWLVPTDDTNALAGDYTYETTFDLGSLDPSTASIFGRWSTDNTGVDILLNGVSTGEENLNGFAGWTDFSIAADEGDLFNAGSNTLTFILNNAGVPTDPPGPAGLRVEFLSSTAAIPEPSSLGLLALAAAFAFARRRRR